MKKKNTITGLEVALTSIAFLLALFWILPFAHNWAVMDAPINLHFALHTPWCVLFGILWFCFGLVGIYYLTVKKDMPEAWITVFIVVLILGIFAMNLWTPASATPAAGSSGVVNNGAIQTNAGTCADSDGGLILDVQGRITPSNVWDSCLNANILTEYFCISGQSYSSQDIDCRTSLGSAACCKTGVCTLDCGTAAEPEYDCTDSDGGINWEVSGHCEDSFHMLGFMDSCSGQTAKEYYCDENGICQSQTKECLAWPNEICAAGVCQKMPCESPLIPATPEQCGFRECSSGGICKYRNATLVSPAKCECAI